MPLFTENRSLYLEITFFNGMSKNDPGNLIFGQVRETNILKIFWSSDFLIFEPHFWFKIFGHFCPESGQIEDQK